MVCFCVALLLHLAVFARDHAQGNEQLVAMVPGLTVCGGDHRIGALNKKVKHHDELSVSEGMCVCVYNEHPIGRNSVEPV